MSIEDEEKTLVIKLLESQSKRLDSIDDNLAEHMRRTDVLEELHRDNQDRIVKLEEPKKAREYLTHVIVDIGKYTGFLLSLYAIGKALSIFS